MGDEPVKILVVDDHEMVRKGLIGYLETEPGIQVIGDVENGLKAVEFCRRNTPDIILMDLIMEEMDGIEATKKILAEYPNIKIIIITSYIDKKQIIPALEGGALSYLLKTSKAEDIVIAIKRAMNNESVIQPVIAAKMLDYMRKDPEPHSTLTERELEVLRLIGNGRSNQEIADLLFIGIKTVKTHVSNIFGKLDVSDRTQAAIYANRNGLV